MSHSLWPHGLQPTRLLCSWNSPSKNAGVGCHSLLKGIFPTQGSNPGSSALQARFLHHLSHHLQKRHPTLTRQFQNYLLLYCSQSHEKEKIPAGLWTISTPTSRTLYFLVFMPKLVLSLSPSTGCQQWKPLYLTLGLECVHGPQAQGLEERQNNTRTLLFQRPLRVGWGLRRPWNKLHKRLSLSDSMIHKSVGKGRSFENLRQPRPASLAQDA